MGGLLSSRYIADENAQIYFHTYDANGNTSELANSIGEISAHYVYDSFGKESSILGNMAALNVYRFSTKPFDSELELYYYGYRCYSSLLGRWINRDPLHELGHKILLEKQGHRVRPSDGNLYVFVDNNPLFKIDLDGRKSVIVVGGVAGLLIACAFPQHQVAHKQYPSSHDKFKHCWVSCRISKTCGAGIAQLAGLSKEAFDRVVAVYCEFYPEREICQSGYGDFWDSINDLIANQQCIGWESYVGPIGGWIGALCRQSCEDCCKKKVGYHRPR